MGAKESKPSCISYEDAVKRVTDAELRRIKETFKKVAGSGGTLISQSAFLQDVLCEGVPPFIADWLFTACGGTQKGISFKDLLCGIVLFTRGSEEEKIKFLWNLYSNDSSTYILKSDYIKAMHLESNSLKDIAEIQELVNKSFLLSLFRQNDRVNFEQFKEWIIQHKKVTVLSKWLLCDKGINLTSELETPTFYQILAGVTHLEEQDIGDLEKVFWSLKGSSKNSQLDLESLALLITPPIPKEALTGVFCAFDENRDGHIDFKELCCGVSAACRGPTVERSKFCFKVFDVDRDGILCYDEVKQMIDILIQVAKESCNVNEYKTITFNHVLNDLIRFSRKNLVEGKAIETVKEQEADGLVHFNLTQEDFMMWSVENSLNIVQPFLDLFFEVCHIVFGLRPQCRHLEGKIVKGWLSREERRGYKVGQFWYLISADWWQSWTQYTLNGSNGSCSYCKVSPNGSRTVAGVDEAIVCDESFNSNSTESMGDLLTTADSSSLGSGSSGVSCGRQNFYQPGPIDNTNLIAPNLYKGIPTLTGEGGHLRRDITLCQHRDFELVPESLWIALSQWYRKTITLPRQVIRPLNSANVEVELYPTNLQILRHQNVAQTQSMSSWSTVSGTYAGITTGGNYATLNVPPILQPPKRYLAYTAAFSRLASIKQVGEFLCKTLKLRQEDIRLWHILSQGHLTSADAACLLEEEYMSLEQLEIIDNDQVLLEVRNKDLTWPEELGSLTLGTSSSERRPTQISVASVHAEGATGLHNLGNTCFMNSALQVLFNTRPLTQYFLKNMHMFELNTANKLGTKGQLAIRYAELLKEVWTASTRSIAPLKLRFCVTKYAPQFAGGGQHDSQELLEWFLDGLHEDLNRVTEKPYTELKDSNGRADEIVAAEAWNAHHARNQSVVIDLFYGQLKSKVSCLCCGKESVRFDPFSLLSLPLPVENYVYCEVLVMLLDGSIPVKYGLRLNSDSKYIDLKKELANLCNLNANLMLVCELSNSQIKCMLHDELKIKASTATDIFVYQLPDIGDDNRSRTSSIIGINIEKGLKDIQRTPALLIASDQPQPNPDLRQPTNDSPNVIINENESTQIHFDVTPENANDLSCNANRRTSKVSRCFGKTMCMPQTLLCFKLDKISTSPEALFTNAHANRKRISMANLLNENTQYSSNSTEDVSSEKNSNEIVDEEEVERSSISAQNVFSSCPCRSNGEFYDDDNNSMQFEQNIRQQPYYSLKNQNCTAGGYLIAVHRKLTRQDSYFLSFHKTRPSLFGIPILIPCYENGTNKDLYCAVWMQVARLLSPLPPTPPDQANHATDCDDSLGYEFPFTLRAVAASGTVCAICPWTEFCRGCEIPCNDDLILQGAFATQSATSSNCSTPKLSSRGTSSDLSQSRLSPTKSINFNFPNGNIFIAIDWDPTALHLRYQSTRERLWTEHETIKICRKQQTEPIDLDYCLKAFTSEEQLEEWYHCSHCKGKKRATKKLQIWRLPPILIIHLKRFNFVNDKWVKSQKVVNFPFTDFDPTPYLASVPQETILRYKELLEMRKTIRKSVQANEKYDLDKTNKEHDSQTTVSEEILQDEVISNSMSSQKVNNMKELIDKNDTLENKDLSNEFAISQNESLQRRKRLISTSLSKTPVVDGDFKDFHHHHLNGGEDKFDLKYRLYAVVSHSGMLNGGHYVAYAANPNGHWYCYNDSSCREIANQPNIDPSSAYLLFYERKGIDYKPYLPNIDGRTLLNNNNLEADDSENVLGKNCVIS